MFQARSARSTPDGFWPFCFGFTHGARLQSTLPHISSANRNDRFLGPLIRAETLERLHFLKAWHRHQQGFQPLAQDE